MHWPRCSLVPPPRRPDEPVAGLLGSGLYALLFTLYMGAGVLAAPADSRPEPGHPQPAPRYLPAGKVQPLYAPSPQEQFLTVKGFWLDVEPVTNQAFLAFVRQHPAWQKGHVPALFSDERYLQHWSTPTSLGPGALPTQPVTWVSWFAARAYCASVGGRLPTEAEWEYAAAASERAADGQKDPQWQALILDWYTRPASDSLEEIGRTPANFYGIRDLHGLVWEWVLEFNSTLVSGDSRDGANGDKVRFCGAGGNSGTNKEAYASFMRYAFRSSLEARFTTARLGFRCAYDKGATPK